MPQPPYSATINLVAAVYLVPVGALFLRSLQRAQRDRRVYYSWYFWLIVSALWAITWSMVFSGYPPGQAQVYLVTDLGSVAVIVFALTLHARGYRHVSSVGVAMPSWLLVGSALMLPSAALSIVTTYEPSSFLAWYGWSLSLTISALTYLAYVAVRVLRSVLSAMICLPYGVFAYRAYTDYFTKGQVGDLARSPQRDMWLAVLKIWLICALGRACVRYVERVSSGKSDAVACITAAVGTFVIVFVGEMLIGFEGDSMQQQVPLRTIAAVACVSILLVYLYVILRSRSHAREAA